MKWDFKSNSNIIYFYVFSSVLLIVTPDKILKKSALLKSFFDAFIRYVPAFSMFEKYSLFPEVSVFVYFFDIMFFIAFLFIPLYKQFKIPDYRYLEWNKKPIFSYFVTPVLLLSISIGLFFFFPGKPGPGGTASGFIDHVVYTSKVGFALGATTMLGCQFLCVIFFARFLSYTVKLIA